MDKLLKIKKDCKTIFITAIPSLLSLIIGVPLMAFGFVDREGLILLIIGIFFTAVCFFTSLSNFILYIHLVVMYTGVKDKENAYFVLLVIGFFIPFMGLILTIFTYNWVKQQIQYQQTNAS